MAIATNDPIRHAILQGIYDDINTYISPPMDTSDFANDDGSLGRSIVATTTSATFTELSSRLQINMTGHIDNGYIKPIVYTVPLFININVANGTVEIGLQVNGNLVPSSVLRMSTPALSNPITGAAWNYTHVIGGAECFGFAGQGTGTAEIQIKLVGRVVSGGSTLTTRNYAMMRAFAKEF